ncbi:hypothetical protein T484DRAFT_1848124 [Baffinella frigidus]|nr:hypothetical protein T484DRAFT_1848124 [Cryptophyta sp. CCMP2293]
MTLEHASDVLCVAFRPDGKELAASSLDGHITIWNAIDGEAAGTIQAGCDAAASSFSTLCYSADGEAIIAGGNTKLCVKKFAVSENRSLDGVAQQLNSKRMTEAGPLGEIDHDSDDERGDVTDRKDDSLPGVSRGAHAKRRRPAARTECARFAPSGRSWAAATTEGLLLFSLDQVSSFDPLDLSLDVTPARIFACLDSSSYLDALLMALRLNEAPVLRAVYQRVPVADVPLLAAALPVPYLKRMLQLVATQVAESPHVELLLAT